MEWHFKYSYECLSISNSQSIPPLPHTLKNSGWCKDQAPSSNVPLGQSTSMGQVRKEDLILNPIQNVDNYKGLV